MKSLKIPCSNSVYQKHVIEYFNKIISKTKDGYHYWQIFLKQYLIQKFLHSLSEEEKQNHFDLRKECIGSSNLIGNNLNSSVSSSPVSSSPVSFSPVSSSPSNLSSTPVLSSSSSSLNVHQISMNPPNPINSIYTPTHSSSNKNNSVWKENKIMFNLFIEKFQKYNSIVFSSHVVESLKSNEGFVVLLSDLKKGLGVSIKNPNIISYADGSSGFQ